MREQTIVWRKDFESIPVASVGEGQSTSETLLFKTAAGEVTTGHVREFHFLNERQIVPDSELVYEMMDVDKIEEFAFLE